jgi:hypothetical protein
MKTTADRGGAGKRFGSGGAVATGRGGDTTALEFACEEIGPGVPRSSTTTITIAATPMQRAATLASNRTITPAKGSHPHPGDCRRPGRR